MEDQEAKLTIVLNHTKSTRGTHVFANDELGITGFYIPKSLLAQSELRITDAPKQIEISIKPLYAVKVREKDA